MAMALCAQPCVAPLAPATSAHSRVKSAAASASSSSSSAAPSTSRAARATAILNGRRRGGQLYTSSSSSSSSSALRSVGSDGATNAADDDEPTSTSPASSSSLPSSSSSSSSAASTMDLLSALLGDSDEDTKAKNAQEEADRTRGEKEAAKDALKVKRGERSRVFRAVVNSTLRLQQLQMVFLDMPIFPAQLQGLLGIKNNNSGNSDNNNSGSSSSGSSSSSDAVGSLPDTQWFDVVLPSNGVDEAAAAATSAASAATAAPAAAAAAAAAGGAKANRSLKPEFIDYTGERLPGEFSIPIVPYPFVCMPGSQVRLNLFEPRWLMLFAKLLMQDVPPAAAATATANAAITAAAAATPAAATPAATSASAASASPTSAAATTTPPAPRRLPPLVLEGAIGEKPGRIDLSRIPQVRAYDSGEDSPQDFVPGFGRMDETPFVGTGTFGALYRRGDGRVAGVGTAMRLVGRCRLTPGCPQVDPACFQRFKLTHDKNCVQTLL